MESTLFLEVSVSEDLPVTLDAVETPLAGPLLAQRVDIVLSDGRRILIEGPTCLLAIVGLVQGLAT